MSTKQHINARRRSHSRHPFLIVLFLIPISALLCNGCVYFNKLYNARKLYRQAEEMPRRDGEVSRTALESYGKVIEKCERLITKHPDSSWVDDAVLLMGKCFYEKGQHNEAIIKFNELEQAFPDSDLNIEGKLYLAKSHIGKDDFELALPVLESLYAAEPKGDFADEVLFLLGTSHTIVGQEDQAVKYLQLLEDNHSDSEYRIDANLEIADIYLEREEFAKSLSTLEKFQNVRLKEIYRARYLSRLTRTYVGLQRYPQALEAFKKVEREVKSLNLKATQLLLKGQAYVGMDSISQSLDTYQAVTASYPRSIFSAEAAFRMGEIYQEELDSLSVAKERFEDVPRQYANSPFAEDAIRRSSNISKLLKLRESIAAGGTEGKAVVQFDLAETELFQFNNHQKALENYDKFLIDHPFSELAPRAAYAVAYIYETFLLDETKARTAYRLIIDRYPDSQQAEYAREALGENKQATEQYNESSQ